MLRNGPSSNRVDIVFMGDGYVAKDLEDVAKVVDDAQRIFERDSVFEEYLAYLNVIHASVVSEEDGIDGFGREYKTALGGRISDGEQSQVTVDRGAVRRILREEMPDVDGLAVVLVRKGSLGTGGGGVAAVAQREFGTVIHELGHAFAELQDEYSTRTGYRGDTRNRINVSNTPDPEEVPWAHFIEAKVRGIGVYEGADGKVRGAWKPTSAGCIMGSGEFFCAVCREALVLRIHDFVDPIDVSLPAHSEAPIRTSREGESLEFSVQVMRPASHRLEVSWWLFAAGEAPGGPPYDPEAADLGRRRERGPLEPIARKADVFGRNNKRGIYRYELKPRQLDPGEYVLVVRAEDTTEVPGDKWPWVLKDDEELLKSERRWKVVVE